MNSDWIPAGQVFRDAAAAQIDIMGVHRPEANERAHSETLDLLCLGRLLARPSTFAFRCSDRSGGDSATLTDMSDLIADTETIPCGFWKFFLLADRAKTNKHPKDLAQAFHSWVSGEFSFVLPLTDDPSIFWEGSACGVMLAHADGPHRRAPSVKAGRGPSDEKILIKFDEMKARGLDARKIAATMRFEPGYAEVATTRVRELTIGRWPRGRPKTKSAS